MLKQLLYIVLLLGAFSNGKAQKILEKSWDSEGIGRLEIISDEVFNIKIRSEETENITVRAKIEGEHHENVVLNIFEKEHVLSISTGFTPYFKAVNDKLAAHKVISIELEVHIPNDLLVFVNSTIASVETLGSFKDIHLELRNGNCVLNDFIGGGTINTKNGNITVFAHETVSAIARTKNGVLRNDLLEDQNFLILAQSVNGDITLLKSQ